MIVQLHTIAFLENDSIESEVHIFSSNDSSDLYILSEIIEEEGLESSEMTKAEFEFVCRRYLYEDVVVEWGQRFVNCIIVNNEQLKRLKNII